MTKLLILTVKLGQFGFRLKKIYFFLFGVFHLFRCRQRHPCCKTVFKTSLVYTPPVEGLIRVVGLPMIFESARIILLLGMFCGKLPGISHNSLCAAVHF